jgi:hypothetical protein
MYPVNGRGLKVKYDSDNSNYGCSDCDERLTLHADGSVTCSCAGVEAHDTNPPAAWDISAQQLAAWRQNELDYQETE